MRYHFGTLTLAMANAVFLPLSRPAWATCWAAAVGLTFLGGYTGALLLGGAEISQAASQRKHLFILSWIAMTCLVLFSASFCNTQDWRVGGTWARRAKEAHDGVIRDLQQKYVPRREENEE